MREDLRFHREHFSWLPWCLGISSLSSGPSQVSSQGHPHLPGVFQGLRAAPFLLPLLQLHGCLFQQSRHSILQRQRPMSPLCKAGRAPPGRNQTLSPSHQLEIRSLVLLTGSSTENNLCIHGQNLEDEVSVYMRQNYRSTAARRSSSSQGDCPTEWCPHRESLCDFKKLFDVSKTQFLL